MRPGDRPARFTLGADATAGTVLIVDPSNGTLIPEDTAPAGAPVSYMGTDLDLPFDDAGRADLALSEAVIAGGWTVGAAAIPVPDVGPMPGLVFRFHRFDGAILRPIVLVLAEEQARKATELMRKAVGAAIRETRR